MRQNLGFCGLTKETTPFNHLLRQTLGSYSDPDSNEPENKELNMPIDTIWVESSSEKWIPVRLCILSILCVPFYLIFFHVIYRYLICQSVVSEYGSFNAGLQNWYLIFSIHYHEFISLSRLNQRILAWNKGLKHWTNQAKRQLSIPKWLSVKLLFVSYCKFWIYWWV